MADDKPPRTPRARSEPGETRDIYRPKHTAAQLGDQDTKPTRRTSPHGHAIPNYIAPKDDMTPPPVSAPDTIEIAAARMDRRLDAIDRRPGPTPTTPALTAALTAHAISGEMGQVMAEELRKDREAQRELHKAEVLSAIAERERNGQFRRDLVWKFATAVLGLATTALGILRLLGR